MLNITVTGENVNDLEIRLVDLMGKVVIRSRGYNPWRVPVDHLAPGIYVLVARSNDYQVTRKVMIR
jgi:hypothetical protein